MKKIFLVALAAIGMTACMQDEVVDIANGGAIAFDNAFVGNATRAESVTTKNLEAFNVWGYVGNPSGVVFNGTLVEEENGLWTYDETQYWMPNNPYWFAAVAPVLDEDAAASWELTMENAQAPRTLALTTDGKTDLVYAHKEVEADDMYEQVAFQFEHLLSKVKLSFTQNLPEYNVAYIENLVVETVKTATIDLNDKVWTPGTETLSLVNDELTTYETEDYFIVPAECNVSFDVVVEISGVEVYKQRKTATIPADAFEMGNAYNLCADINPNTLALNEIEFSANVTDWVPAGNTSDAAANLLYAAQVGGKCTLTEDVVLDAPLAIPAGVELVLDLGGNTIEAALKETGRHHYAIDNYGTLVIEGEGAINARGIENFGVMEINGNITITNVDTNGGAAIWNEGRLTINAGTYTTNDAAGEGSYGAALNTRPGGEAVVNGGTFCANSQLTYAIINDGKTTIYNADVKGKHGAVAGTEASSADVTEIYGGTYALLENPGVSDHCVYEVSAIYGGSFTLGNNTDCGAQVFYNSTIADGYKKVEANGVWTVSLDTVADTAELQAALADDSKASIYLAPGATFEGTFNVTRTVEIVSNANNKPTIKGRVNVSGGANNEGATFKNVKFSINEASKHKNTFSGAPYKYPGIVVAYGTAMTFEGCDFETSISAGVCGINAGNHSDSSDLLTVNNCTFVGDFYAIRTRTLFNITNSEFDVYTNQGTLAAVFTWGNENSGANKVTFTGNTNKNANKVYGVQMTSTNFPYDYITINVQGNTNFHPLADGVNPVMFNGTHSFANGSETF